MIRFFPAGFSDRWSASDFAGFASHRLPASAFFPVFASVFCCGGNSDLAFLLTFHHAFGINGGYILVGRCPAYLGIFRCCGRYHFSFLPAAPGYAILPAYTFAR